MNVSRSTTGLFINERARGEEELGEILEILDQNYLQTYQMFNSCPPSPFLVACKCPAHLFDIVGYFSTRAQEERENCAPKFWRI